MVHAGRAIGCARRLRIAGQAIARQSFFSVFAESAGDVERQADPIVLLHSINSGADLNDYAEIFMSEDAALLEAVATLVLCKSEPQMFVVVIRITTSVGFSIRASSTLPTLTSRWHYRLQLSLPRFPMLSLI